MNKSAAGRSNDPKQQALRDAKAKWNKDTSDFIADVIQYKKMMNGWPSKFNAEKGKIQNPLSEKSSSVLSLLTLNFKDIAEQAHSLSQQQLEYSKTRKQKSVKDATNIIATQLHELETFASNPLSRFFSRIKNTALFDTEKARVKKYRMSLLSAGSDIYQDILLLQEEAVKSSPQSIFVTSQLLEKIQKRWEFVGGSLNTYKNSISELSKDTDKEKDVKDNSNSEKDTEKQNPFSDVESIIIDIKRYVSNFNTINPKEILQKISKFESSSNDKEKQFIAKLIAKDYEKLLLKANKIDSTEAKSFKELSNLKAALQSTAQNAVNKWMGKLKHKISPFDKTSAFRLDIYNKCKEVLKLVDDFMDLLESGFNLEELYNIYKSVSEKLQFIKSIANSLLKTVDGKSFEGKFIDLLEKGDLSEHDVDFDKKQKERFQRMLELQRFRDLAKQYQGSKK